MGFEWVSSNGNAPCFKKKPQEVFFKAEPESTVIWQSQGGGKHDLVTYFNVCHHNLFVAAFFEYYQKDEPCHAKVAAKVGNKSDRSCSDCTKLSLMCVSAINAVLMDV